MGHNVLRAALVSFTAASALATIGGTAPAAATVELPSVGTVYIDSDTPGHPVLRYLGTAGNDLLDIDVSGSVIEVRHFSAVQGQPAAPIAAGPGCVVVLTAATCGAYTAGLEFRAITGDGADVVATSMAFHGVIDTGSGNDRWRRLDAPIPAGPSSSIVFTGGEGFDIADYTALRDIPLAATIDNIANDGTTGDTDNITRSVESATLPKP
ncbi:hypothetical protein ACTG9Q_15425 [Actinokineospora sp. 24-640]